MYNATSKDAGETSGGEGKRRRSPAEMKKDELKATLAGVIDTPKLRAHGRLSKRNPFIGYFHHAPR